jgi:hypothetical protein
MSETKLVVEIKKPHFTISLYEKMLCIDLKGTLKDELEEALENKPILRETAGRILGIFVPLHIQLSSIESVTKDEIGSVKIHCPHHRDIVIPLEPKEAKRLADKLNQLIPEAKEKELEQIMKEHKLRKIVEEEQLKEKEEEVVPMGTQFPIPQPPSTREKIIEEIQKKQS